MDPNNTLSPEELSTQIDSNIEARQLDAVNAAERVQGTQPIEAQQSRVFVEKQFDGRSGLDVAGESLMRTGADLNAAGAVVRSYADFGPQGGTEYMADSVMRTLGARSKFLDDPDWNPRKNPDQMSYMTKTLNEKAYLKSIGMLRLAQPLRWRLTIKSRTP